jgi:hypothetical protein
VLAGQKENVEKLLTHGMRVQHQSSADGATPLHRAAQVGNIEIALVLINRGADLNAPNYLGQTSLHIALEKNFPDFAKFLLSKGARRKCKHTCIRCQTFSDSIQKQKQENQTKKQRNRGNVKNDREPFSNTVQVTQDEIQDHFVLENEYTSQQVNNQKQQIVPVLTLRDFSNVSIANILSKASQQTCENNSNSNDSVGSINLSDEIKKEKKALGGPMFSIEENEKLRREKMRGGYFKEGSSESSNGGSDPPSPNGQHHNNISDPLTNQEKKQKQQHKKNKDNRHNI